MFDFLKALLNERGEAGDSSIVTDGNGPDWRPHAESLKSDPAIAPHLDGIGAKDVTALVKEHVNLKGMMGKALFPKDNPTPEELRGMRNRAYDMKLFSRPPESAEHYNFDRPEAIPEDAWSEETVGEYRGWANKWGIPQEAINEAMAIQSKQFGGLDKLFEISPEEKAVADKTFQEKAEKAGISVEKAIEDGGRYLKENVSERVQKILAMTNLGADPELMFLIAQAGHDTREDTSVDTGDQGTIMNSAENEALDIQTNKENPDYKIWHDTTHPQHRQVREKVARLWDKAHPGTLSL